jgi:nucleotide-binding universal stress UspA family protein
MVFDRVLVGFDGSATSELALDLGLKLRAPGGELESLTVAETHFATHAGMEARTWDERIRREAERQRAAAEVRLGGAAGTRARLVAGYAAACLLSEAGRTGADLISVGSHGHSRIGGILLGSVATRVAHDSPCSVLVARPAPGAAGEGVSIVAGMDESPAADDALAVAGALAEAIHGRLERVTAVAAPVATLVEASRSADLLVLGSRGAHGLAALGSVAERVAHEAACPVLIVRGMPRSAAGEAAAQQGAQDAEAVH